MAGSGDNKVTVRVEVVVEGAGPVPVLTTVERPCDRKRPYDIITPQTHPSDTTVTPRGSLNYVSASGHSALVSGNYAKIVWAMAYPDPTVQSAQHLAPPDGAPHDTPSTDDGSWSFTQAKGNLVPGAKADNIVQGADNSTLLVWYDFDGTGTSYQMDRTIFHGYLATKGTSLSSCRPRATTLHATFTGALAGLGTVPLHWNGASWVGVSSHCGGSVLSFLWGEPVCHFVSSGPGTTFVLAEAPGAHPHFTWSAAGTAFGSLAGPFRVTLTE
jgi:hypothetical protein